MSTKKPHEQTFDEALRNLLTAILDGGSAEKPSGGRWHAGIRPHAHRLRELLAKKEARAPYSPDVWVLSRLWVDSMENTFNAAHGYKPEGVCLTESEADRAIAAAGDFIGTGWPFYHGQQIPNLKKEKVSLVFPPSDIKPLHEADLVERKPAFPIHEADPMREMILQLGGEPLRKALEVAAMEAIRKRVIEIRDFGNLGHKDADSILTLIPPPATQEKT
jgi:hypothetical protein